MNKFKRVLLVAGLGIAMAMTGCTLFGSQASTDPAKVALTPAQKVQAAAVTIDDNCTVGAPLVATLRALQTDQGAIDLLGTFQDKAGQVCKVAAAVAHPVAGASLPTLDLAGAKSFLDAQTPALIGLVKSSKLDDKAKSATILAITGAQLALTMAALNQ
jgi:hypothetical protein